MNNWCMTLGWLVGRTIAGQRKKRTPVAYRYNGEELPLLPEEWDSATHPCAVITVFISTTILRFGQIVYETHLSDGVEYYRYGMYGYQAYELQDDFTWTLIQDEPKETVWIENIDDDSVYTKWSNTDILNKDGTVHLAASDPVPVYE